MSAAGNAVKVCSVNKQIALYNGLTKGLITLHVPGLVAGPVSVNVWSSAGALVTYWASSMDVVASTSGIYSYKYQVKVTA